MLSVLPIQSKSEQEAVCRLCGIEYDIELLAYKLSDDESIVGICQFKMAPEGGVIKNLVCRPGNEHFEYLLMLGRGTLNFCDNCGARYAYLDDGSIDALTAKAIGFSPNSEGRQTVDLLHFFEEPCKKH